MEFGANIIKRRTGDGYTYYDMDKGTVVTTCQWKRHESSLHILSSNFINLTIINDIERYCYENNLNVIFAKSDLEIYTKFGFKFDTEGRMIKRIRTKPIRKDKSIPMTKQNYPMIASIMSIYHE